MPSDDYRRALEAAAREYETLGAERQHIDKRLSELAQTIATLSRLCGLTPTVPWGLTDACRTVLRNAGAPMTPSDVRDRLQGIGYDLASYSNPLAAIHTTLKRLAEAEELRTASLQGKPGYLWHRPPKSGTHVLLNAEINREIARAHRPKRGKR
ncbi:MAG TPA: hypothetical protein VFO67_04240 [Gemmatimonadales bacterium]|nr:hypothetical protein [Gemmatimonadales bacterium]